MFIFENYGSYSCISEKTEKIWFSKVSNGLPEEIWYRTNWIWRINLLNLSQDLEIPRNSNNKLVDQVTRLERKCWENEKYSRRERIEISGIPQSIEQIDL